MIDPTSIDELERFFNVTEGLTPYQQATLAGISVQTVGNWRRKLGIHGERHPNFVESPAKPEELPIVENWNNREWFIQAYEIFGITKIAKMIGRKPGYVWDKIRRYKIKPKPHHTRVFSKNEFCDEEWLVYHYCRRVEYEAWCEENKVELNEHGGQALPVVECSKLAGVVQATIVNWLTKFNIRVRDLSESRTGALNPQYGKKRTPQEKRAIRRKFFDAYRSGKRVLRMGPYLFANGRLLGTQKNLAASTVKGPRI